MAEPPATVPSPTRRFPGRISKSLKGLSRLFQCQDNSIPPQANATCFFYLNERSTETETELADPLTDDQISEQTTMSLNPCREASGQPPDIKKVGIGMKLKSILKIFFTNKDKCVGCYEDIRSNKLIIAPCEHRYCHRCIRKMALFALRNRTQFPVRCCNEIIPLELITSALSTRTKRLYTSRIDEDAVPPTERLYCPHTSCRQWIHSKYLKPGDTYQRCPRCRTMICSRCRDLAHADRECAEDPGLADVLLVARRNHWQRCFSCHAMVEKVGGCQHIRCRCGAEFCYACGRSWPGCRCWEVNEVDYDGNATILEEDRDLDVAIFLTAMDRAEMETATRDQWGWRLEEDNE